MGAERRRGGGGRRGPGRPRRPLDPERILAAAIGIADGEGLDAVSIRRIAAAVDARPMSIYQHFESKDELLAAMADHVVAEVLVPEGLPVGWRAAVRTIARRNYAVFRRHPWLPAVYGHRPALGPNALAATRQSAEAVRDMPLVEPEERWTLFGTALDYVLGHSLRAIAAPEPDAFEEWMPEPEMEATPELASLPSSMRSRTTIDRFEAGLEAVLDGIERCLEEAARRPGDRAS